MNGLLDENWKRLGLCILLEGLLIAAGSAWERGWVYMLPLFFIIVICLLGRDVHLYELTDRFTYGAYFWKPFLLGLLLMIVCYETRNILQNTVFWNQSGQVHISVLMSGLLEMILYAVTQVLLIPLGEELFFRRGLVRCHPRWAALCGCLMSFALYSCLYARGPVGLLDAALMSIPLYVIYWMTEDFYIVFLVHFCINAYETIPRLLYSIARMVLS